MFVKANVPYLIANSLATLTLISSLVLAVTSNVPLPLILVLAVLSVLVVALSCKMISSNKKVETEKNKFAEKEQGLESEIGRLNEEIGRLGAQRTDVQQKLDDTLKKLSGKESQIWELEDRVKGLCTQLSAFADFQVKQEVPLRNYNQDLKEENQILKSESGHSSEFEGIGKNTFASTKRKIEVPPDEFLDAEEDLGYISRCSTPVGRY